MKKQFTIKEQGGNFVFEIVVPKQAKRFNPYMEEESEQGKLGSYTSVTGLIDEQTDEYGFAFTIDMDYKNKDDQFSDFFLEVSSFIERTEFELLCKQRNIPFAILHPRLKSVKNTKDIYDDIGDELVASLNKNVKKSIKKKRRS